jgi:hypothetical protein
MKKFIAITALAATVATASSPAMAWGDREQGALAGIIGTIIFQDIYRNRQGTVYQQQPQVIVQQPAPVYQQQIIIQQDQHSWGSNRVCSEQIVRRADGSQSTLQMNCAGRVIGEIIYNKY